MQTDQRRLSQCGPHHDYRHNSRNRDKDRRLERQHADRPRSVRIRLTPAGRLCICRLCIGWGLRHGGGPGQNWWLGSRSGEALTQVSLQPACARFGIGLSSISPHPSTSPISSSRQTDGRRRGRPSTANATFQGRPVRPYGAHHAAPFRKFPARMGQTGAGCVSGPMRLPAWSLLRLWTRPRIGTAHP